MPAADGNGHAANADRDGVAAERTEVQRLDGDPLIEAEVPQAAGLALVQAIPSDRRDARLGPDLQLVERDAVRLKCRVLSCD